MIIAIALSFLLCCNTCVLFRKKKDIFNSINYPTDDDDDKKDKKKKKKSEAIEVETSRPMGKQRY